MAAGRIASTAPAAEAIHVSKSFGTNLVLRDVSITVPRGSARALVGRNGAGKSTLVGVLTGLLTADQGGVAFEGEPALPTRTGSGGRRQVACVYQKSTLVPTISVAENLFINRHPGPSTWVDWADMRQQAQAILDEWNLGIDADTVTERLRVEQRQVVEIARALLQGARFLILDEPTAALESKEIDRLFERIRRLKSEGVTLLYISHHLQEIYDICDSVTVMRDGRVVADAPLTAMPKQDVVAAMLGDGVALSGSARATAPVGQSGPVLQTRNLASQGLFADIDVEVWPGECVGLAGLGSSGKEEIGEVIAGLREPASGTVSIDGVPIGFGDVATAQRRGVSYVPRDRRRRGILPQLSIAENLTVTVPGKIGRAGFLSSRKRDELAGAMARALGVVCTSIEQPVGELSGGNQQKVVMGRALASEPKVLVLVYPTQGVDVAAKEALFGIVREAQSAGTGVLLISDEVDELRICNRVLVIFKGRLVRSFGLDWSERDLIAAVEGVDA